MQTCRGLLWAPSYLGLPPKLGSEGCCSPKMTDQKVHLRDTTGNRTSYNGDGEEEAAPSLSGGAT